jgi:hypothetical protein
MRAGLILLAVVVGAAALAQTRRADAVNREACFSSAESAQQLRAQDKLRGARDALLVCAQSECPASVQRDCARWLVEVNEALPTLVFTAHDKDNNDLADVRVSVDGKVVASTIDGRPVELDPGSHMLRYDRAGSRPVMKSIVVAAGQKLRAISIGMEPLPAPKGAAANLPVAPIIVLGGVGVAALVSMTGFWIAGRSEYSQLEGSCMMSCNPSQVDPVRAKLIVGDVSGGIAIASLGVATWLFFTRRPADVPAVGFVPTSRGAVASLKLGF